METGGFSSSKLIWTGKKNLHTHDKSRSTKIIFPFILHIHHFICSISLSFCKSNILWQQHAILFQFSFFLPCHFPSNSISYHMTVYFANHLHYMRYFLNLILLGATWISFLFEKIFKITIRKHNIQYLIMSMPSQSSTTSHKFVQSENHSLS